ncbi:hypothetical protein GQ44DRAFT_710364 [Phaeosphaeriaceae sp. PMI808]|nr:hypothetical protein GQ44DRAFT_710364 [Phaeosphaeriaceae sp. PMI808]
MLYRRRQKQNHITEISMLAHSAGRSEPGMVQEMLTCTQQGRQSVGRKEKLRYCQLLLMGGYPDNRKCPGEHHGAGGIRAQTAGLGNGRSPRDYTDHISLNMTFTLAPNRDPHHYHSPIGRNTPNHHGWQLLCRLAGGVWG